MGSNMEMHMIQGILCHWEHFEDPWSNLEKMLMLWCVLCDMKVSFISYLHLLYLLISSVNTYFPSFVVVCFFRRCLSRCPHWTWHWNPANGFKRCSVSRVEVLDASCQFQIVWPHSSRAKMKKLHSNLQIVWLFLFALLLFVISWKAQPLVASMAHAIDQIALVCVREAGIDPGNTRASNKSFLINFNCSPSSVMVFQLCPAYPTCVHAHTKHVLPTTILYTYTSTYWIYCIIMYGDPYIVYAQR